MTQAFSYRHLHYFWVVAKEGGIARGAQRLGVAVQTVSAQVRELERELGCALLKPAGRGVALTDAGMVAMRQADQIFALGERLPALVRDAAAGPALRLAVGISDGLPKFAAQRLLELVTVEPGLHLVCHEGEFEDLLGDLALHRLDVVLSDRAAPPNPNLRVYSHRLGASPITWFAPPAFATVAGADFPRSLARVPVLLPTVHSAMRAAVEQWFERESVQPHLVGEFEDSALLAAFAAAGMGVFPAAALEVETLVRRYGVTRVGDCGGLVEHFYAIGTERKVHHPLVQRMIEASTTHAVLDPASIG